MPYDDTYIRQMLMGGQPDSMSPEMAMVQATQQQGNPQMPQLQQSAPMNPQPEQEETRKPGFVKGMLMDFTGTLREALQREMGVETDQEKKMREFKMRLQSDAAQLAVQKYQQDQQLQNAQMQHMGAQERRANAELEMRKAMANAQMMQKENAETAGEKLTGEMSARAKMSESLHLEGQDRVNFIAGRDVQKPAKETAATETELALQEAKGDPALARQLIQKGRIATAQASRPPASEKAPAGTLIPLTDQVGNVRGFYNNKTGQYQEAGSVPQGSRRAGVPGQEMSQRAVLDDMLTQIEQIKPLAEKNQDVIGAVSGRVEGLKQETVGGRPEAVTLFRMTKNLGDQLLRARSGAQINEQEYQRMIKLVPSEKTPYSTFVPRVNALEEELKRLISKRTGNVPFTGGAPTGAAPKRKRFNPTTGKIE